MTAVCAPIAKLVNGVLDVSTRYLDYTCCREADLTVLPVFTMLDDNLQHLVELSMTTTVAEQAAWLLCTYYFKMMSLLIVLSIKY